MYYSGSVALLGALSESYEKFHAYECTRNFRCTAFHDVFGIKAEDQQERKRDETYRNRWESGKEEEREKEREIKKEHVDIGTKDDITYIIAFISRHLSFGKIALF